ncbi:MAG: CRISPR-associated endonuclease Cas1 [Ignisphaera sp.]|nr:CRISPR-associated endonuclease Cas1 [Ignisphaera sp.]MDW8086308.1 CRISPR-associated endonuclease Cas1 [Ignisphaera sp.]
MNIAVVEGYGVKIGFSRGTIVVRSREGRKILPVAELDRIVVTSSGVSITSRAVRALANYGVDLVFLDARGAPVTSLTPIWITATVETRRAQYKAFTDPYRAASIARSFAEAKIVNQGLYIKYLSKSLGAAELGEDAERILSHVDKLTLDFTDFEKAQSHIISVEASAARLYWSAIASLLPRDLKFPGRDHDGADQVNRALNYLYGILYTECFKALTRFGFDPYAGFLHSDRSGNPSLVFDFAEMFRVSAVDSMLIRLVREGLRVGVDERGFIDGRARARLVREFYKWIERRVRSVDGEVKSVRGHINSYSLKLSRALRSGALYRGFVERWWG